MNRYVGIDKNNQDIYLNDYVKVYTDYTENQLYGMGKLISKDGIIQVHIINPYEHFHPFTDKLYVDMGQQGINVLNYTYEKCNY